MGVRNLFAIKMGPRNHFALQLIAASLVLALRPELGHAPDGPQWSRRASVWSIKGVMRDPFDCPRTKSALRGGFAPHE